MTTRFEYGVPTGDVCPSPCWIASVDTTVAVRLNVTVAVGASDRVAVIVIGPPAVGVTVALAMPPVKSVGPLSTTVALPLVTTQPMVTPPAGRPEFCAITDRSVG